MIATGRRLTERERDERKAKQYCVRYCGDVAYIVDLRIGRFSDFPAIPRGRSVLISITFGSQTQIGFLFLCLSLFLSSFPSGRDKKPRSAGRRRWWSSRKGKRMGRDEGNGERPSLIFRVLAPPFPRKFSFHFARPPGPLFHFAALFAENS